MTDNEIRIAIAEVLGWSIQNTNGEPAWHLNGIRHEEAPPLYCDDLNAMHEAESTLESSDNHQVSAYFEALHNVVGVLSDNPQWAMIHATARQRAEAFLRVKGKWK